MGSYSVEPAKSGRSTCRGKCKGAIAEGELRWGSHPETIEHDMCYWSHLDCVSLKTIQTAIEVHGTLAEIPGVVEHDAVGLLTAAVATAQRTADEKEAAKQSVRDEKAAVKLAEKELKAQDKAQAKLDAKEARAKEAAEAPAKAPAKKAAPKKKPAAKAKPAAEPKKRKVKDAPVAKAAKKNKKVPASPA